MTESFKDALKLNEDHPFNKPLSTRPRLLGQVPGMLMNLESDLVLSTLQLTVGEGRWKYGVAYCQGCRAKRDIWRKIVEGEKGIRIREMG
jgi:hypothetical protein